MDSAILETIDASVTYSATRSSGQQPVPTVRDVNLTIEAGETYGLLGFSGCGKTTVAKAIAGLLPLSSGRILVGGQCRPRAGTPNNKVTRHQPVSMVFQDPTGSLNPRIPIGRSVEEPLLLTRDYSRLQRCVMVGSMLERVGLSEADSRRFPHEFSGGQRQRVAIARALISNPKLVICDEPVSALDLSIQAQIVNLLAELQKETGVSYLFITHNVDLARLICARIAIMSAGTIVEQGNTRQILDNPHSAVTKELVSSAITVSLT